MNTRFVTAVLIDDEMLAIENLRYLINTHCKSIKIIATADGADEGITTVNHLKPEVVFLDINMPRQTGFDLLGKLEYMPQVVFVTAHEKYALKALKACALDFLLKPIVIEELKQAESKLVQIQSLSPEIRKNYSQVLGNLTSMLNKADNVRKITIYGRNGYEIFDVDSILYVSGEDNYSLFHFTKQHDVMVSKTLKEYEEILEPFGFMRIHKSTLVNLAHVKKITHNDGIHVLMEGGELLAVSRRKSPDILVWSKRLGSHEN